MVGYGIEGAELRRMAMVLRRAVNRLPVALHWTLTARHYA